MNIFVANLSFRLTEDDLRDMFEQFGTVDSAKIILDRDTGRSKGFGFVEMPDDDEARDAISNLNEAEVEERPIVVKEARPRENNRRDSYGGGGRRGGGGYGGGYGGGRY